MSCKAWPGGDSYPTKEAKEKENIKQKEIETLESALNYIKHTGSNFTVKGLPHPQQHIIDDLEELIENKRNS